MTDLEISAVPPADKFFPSCFWGLVELVARHKFDVPSIKRAWFNHSFVYVPPPTEEVVLAENGVDLALFLSSSNYADDHIERKVREYFGIGLEATAFEDYPTLLDAIRGHLRNGEIVISTYDIGFQPTRREYKKVYLGHTVGLVGWDSARQVLLVADQFQGRIEIPLADYAACFEYCREINRPFTLTQCARSAARADEAALREDLRRDIAACLENLRSSSPTLGLAGLKWAARDVATACREFAKPFAFPGMWRIGKDRWCVSKTMGEWPVALDERVATRLKRLLDQLFRTWFGIDMTIEASFHLNDVAKTREIARMLASAVAAEEEATDLLETVWGALR